MKSRDTLRDANIRYFYEILDLTVFVRDRKPRLHEVTFFEFQILRHN